MLSGSGTSRRVSGEPRLDPVRWRLPRGSTLVRGVAVVALLLTAAGVLYAGSGASSPSRTAPPSVPREVPAATGQPAASAGPSPDGRLAVPAGAVGVPVRLAEPAALAVLRPGDRVDLFAVTTGTPDPADGSPADRPAVIAAGALVLAVPGDDTGHDELGGPGVLYLALPAAQARVVVGSPPSTRFAVIVRP